MATTPTSPGVNQDGAAATSGVAAATADGRGTPGEILLASPGAPFSAAGPDGNSEFPGLTVQTAFDLAVQRPLRNKLIWDQFATPKSANLNISGWDKVRLFFGGEIPAAGADTPLVENLDVDSVVFGGRHMELVAKEYGRAVSRTRMSNVKAQINIDPEIVDRTSWDAARATDLLALKALTGANPATPAVPTATYYEASDPGTGLVSNSATIPLGTGDTYLSTTILQVAISMLEQVSAIPFMTGQYVVLCNPVGAQHLKNERDTGGFRYVTARNEGSAGNSIFRGQIGMIEGADVVVSNTVPVGTAYLLAKDGLAKVFTNKEGYGAQAGTVVAPVVDKLRRFLSWGWLHYVGYSVYDTRAIVEIKHTNKWRPAGTANAGTPHGTPVGVTNWPIDYGPLAPGIAFGV